MARATKKAQVSEDLWHLSIDDLFASTIVMTPEPVAGPFVINLSLSSAPSGAMPRGMPRYERLCVFQLKSTVDERRDEYRLRIGIIETELEADAILGAVREHYPAARKETASEEDSRAVDLRRARAAQRAAAVKRAEPKPPPPRKKIPNPAPTRDVMLRAKVSDAQPAAPQPWNVDDVLPQFAGLATVKCAPTKRHPAQPPGQKPPSAASQPAAAAPVEPEARPSRVAAPARAPAAPQEAASAHAAPAQPSAPVAPLPDVVIEFTAPMDPAPAVEPAALTTAPSEPEPVEPGVAVAPRSGDDLDSDPNAITTEVEALTFTIEAPVPALELTIEAPVPVSGPASQDSVTVEALSSELEITVEAASPLSEITIEAPHIAATVSIETPVLPVLEPPPPIVPSTSDSGSLEQLVAKLDTMVEEVEANAETRTLQIDSTQTQRALTPLELADEDKAAGCYVVQLILSENEIDPEHVPSLDIFNEYRLYRVTGLHQDNVKHALRLGFFGSEPAAQAVAGYLAIFFDSPTITRVSVAERDRFADDRLAARKDVGESGTHAIIELTSPVPLPKRSERVVVSQEPARAKSSLWSRLGAALKR